MQLLRHNADVSSRGFCDWTPLHHAAGHGQTKVIQLFLEYAADVNALSEGHNTPLRIAVGLQSLEVVQLLVAQGADVHIRDEEALRADPIPDG
jgi:hypothetical protein